MSSDDKEYYRQRAAAELELAEKATNPDVSSVHQHLALKYAGLAASLDMGEESRWQGITQNKCR